MKPELPINQILQGDCLELLKQLPDECVDCCVTSPPYFGLRDYGVSGQIGLEATPAMYVAKMVSVFEEVRRVLKPQGVLWLNIGDSYAGISKGQNKDGSSGKVGVKQESHKGTRTGKLPMHRPTNQASSTLQGGKKTQVEALRLHENVSTPGLKPKDLIGIPWMLAFAIRNAGWYLRQDIIWHKPNPMPESVTDRCTKSHEYIFLLSKSAKYYFDAGAIKTYNGPFKGPQTFGGKKARDGQINGGDPINGHRSDKNSQWGKTWEPKIRGHKKQHNGFDEKWDHLSKEEQCISANKRSVWTIPTTPYKDAHFATFPEDLIVDCIKAGSKGGGIILDPFMGAGTTAVVAQKLGRNFIGMELNASYIKIAERRMKKELGMFNKHVA